MEDHLLAEAGVGAGATRLGAVKACLYALDERIGVYGSGARVSSISLAWVIRESCFSGLPSRK